ncbi:hypothetical protein [Radiobacillus sp. PE A8.2]|uniref:spr1630 family ClpXP-sensitive toxin n=1 Tax=Radiobacillus sp. PE A8.2 TaxID=3380349 RepID=UPI00388F279E
MEKYKFNPNDSEMIVNAIVEGYRDYIEHRKDRHEKMTISSAFAWTKGNFIESKIAEISPELNLSYKRSKAGLTWDYLQFIHGETKKLFLIKNAAYFNENCFSQAVLPNNINKGHTRTYLHELSKINQSLDFLSPTSIQHSSEPSEQLSLFVTEEQIKDEIELFQSDYDEFHILTYKIDDAYQISEIMHYLPNPANNIAYRIENLSEYISNSELTDEEREVIAPEQDHGIIDPAAFDIGIFEDKDKETN